MSGTPSRWAFVSFDAPGSSPTTRPVVFFETEPVTFAPCASSAAVASSRENRLERAGDHVGRAGQRPLGRPLLLADLEPQAEVAQLLDERAVLLVGEPLDDDLGAVRPEALDVRDLLLRSPRSAGRRCRSAARGSARAPSRCPGCSGRAGRARTAPALASAGSTRSRRSRRSRAKPSSSSSCSFVSR